MNNCISNILGWTKKKIFANLRKKTPNYILLQVSKQILNHQLYTANVYRQTTYELMFKSVISTQR